MKFAFFDVDSCLRETTHHGDTDLPVAVYLQQLDKNKEGFLILHWHEEVQFVLCQQGDILYTVSEQAYYLSPGDILFINSRCLHMAKPISATSGSYICIDIHPRFLSGYSNSLIDRIYVAPVLASKDFSALLIDGSAPWHDQVKQLLKQLVTTFESKNYAYELQILGLFIQVWTILLENEKGRFDSTISVNPAEQARMDRVLTFIQEHYMKDLTLKDFARELAVSESECCRIFRRNLGISPFTYLNNLRIVKSTTLLTKTDMSMTEISHQVGFNSGSYYSSRFKKTMNCSPLDYRKRHIKKTRT